MTNLVSRQFFKSTQHGIYHCDVKNQHMETPVRWCVNCRNTNFLTGQHMETPVRLCGNLQNTSLLMSCHVDLRKIAWKLSKYILHNRAIHWDSCKIVWKLSKYIILNELSKFQHCCSSSGYLLATLILWEQYMFGLLKRITIETTPFRTKSRSIISSVPKI